MPSTRKKYWWIVFGTLVAITALTLEILGWKNDFIGPFKSTVKDIIGPPKSGTIIWLGLILALVFFPKKLRLKTILSAVVLDTLFAIGWYWGEDHLSYGNGALLIMFFLLIFYGLQKSLPYANTIVKGVGLGLLFILANKIADSWLSITAIYKKEVLDEYLAVFDQILWQPSWKMGKFLNWLGPQMQWVIKFIYVQLPLAGIIIAVYQLYRGYTQHNIIKSFLAVGIVGPLVYLLFPVVGPVYFFSNAGKGFNIQDIWPNIYPQIIHPVAFAFDRETPRNCMPSLHIAWATIIFIHSLHTNKYLQTLGIIWLISTVISTLGFGYHYGTDLIAGIVFASIIETIFRAPHDYQTKLRYLYLICATATFGYLLFSYRYLTIFMADHLLLARFIYLGLPLSLVIWFYYIFTHSKLSHQPLGTPQKIKIS